MTLKILRGGDRGEVYKVGAEYLCDPERVGGEGKGRGHR